MISTKNILSKAHFLSENLKKSNIILSSQNSIYDVKTGYDILQNLSQNNITIEKETGFNLKDDMLYLVKHAEKNHVIISSFSIERLSYEFDRSQVENVLSIISLTIGEYLEHILDSSIENLEAKFREDSTAVFFDITNAIISKHDEVRTSYMLQLLNWKPEAAEIIKVNNKLMFKALSIQLSDKL